MKNALLKAIFALVCFILVPAWIRPDEGMWIPTQLDKLPWKEMQKRGMVLSPHQIFDTSASSLTRATVLLSGGTGGFVSADGLIITNHHVAFSGIQSVSSVQDDYLRNGFLAARREDELPLPSYNAEFVTQISDVTDQVVGGLADDLSDNARADSIRSRLSALQGRYKAMAGDGDSEFRISEMYAGNRYLVFRSSILRDVRLVYAPPGSIGVFGGEIDNWVWPRHTGDFAMVRAYVGPDGKHATYAKENVPYHPSVFLPFSTKPLTEGSFAMVLGFPGRTYRYRTDVEIELARDETLPLQMRLLKQRLDIIDQAGAHDRATQIKYASAFRRLANTYKNIQGTLEGMRRSDIRGDRQSREKAFTAFLSSHPDLETKYGTLLSDIANTYAAYKTFDQKQIALSQIPSSSDALQLANGFIDLAASFRRDSTGKEGPDPNKLAELQKRVPLVYKNFVAGVDNEALSAMVLAAAELPSDQQVKAVRNIVEGKTGEKRDKAVREFVDNLYSDSKLKTAEGATDLLGESAETIRKDPFVRFAADLQQDNNELQPQVAKFNATISRLRGKLLQAWIAWKGNDLYPDANRTLRVTVGEVKPYKPRDAVFYNYITTLGGVMEKETGEEPFIVPPKLRQLWEKKDFGSYADPTLNDVPVAFISNLDITGGNSGSPILNGNGELIGVAFDGNWEAVVGDYLFQEPLNRCIGVDSRYVLFVLDKFSNAQNILNELVIRGTPKGD